MLKRSADFTVDQLAELLALEKVDVRNFLNRKKLKFKKVITKKEQKKIRRRESYLYAPDPPKKIIHRPAAIYTNKTPYGIANHF